MKTLLITNLLVVATFCRLLAQTNSPSPDKKINKDEDRVRLLMASERTIQTDILVSDGETSCQVSYRGHTNIVVYVPLPEEVFDARLYSMEGKEIPKTFDCKFGQKLKPDKALLTGSLSYFDGWRVHDRRLDFKNGNTGDYWRFDILKSFQVKKAGEYRLQVQVRLFSKDTNGLFQPFILPPVETKVVISERDLGQE